MNNFFIKLILISTFSLTIYAQEKKDLTFTTFTKSEKNFSLFQNQAGLLINEVSNMPPIRSQGNVGICYAFAAATVLQRYYCNDLKFNCATMPPEKTISPISTMFYLKPNPSLTSKTQVEQDAMTLREKFRSLFINIGGSAYDILRNTETLNQFRSEACFPFSEFQKIFGDSDEQLNKVIAALKANYNKNRLEADAPEACPECMAKMSDAKSEIMKVMQSSNQLADYTKKKLLNERNLINILKSESFEEYMFRVFYGCSADTISKINHKNNAYPDKIGQATKEDHLKKIDEVIATDNPILMQGPCMTLEKISNPQKQVPYYTDKNYTCTERHTFVISGSATECKNNVCKKYYKIHNSWGKGWLDKSGADPENLWVDGDKLVSALSFSEKDSNGVQKNTNTATLVWITRPQ